MNSFCTALIISLLSLITIIAGSTKVNLHGRSGLFSSVDEKLWIEDPFFSGKNCTQVTENGQTTIVNTNEGKYSLDKSQAGLDARLLTAYKVGDERIKEASGLVASRVNKGVFWTHNDSGDSAIMYAIGSKGENSASYVLKNCQAIDIEDIAAGPGPEDGVSYIYLADIGDNGKKRKIKKIYRFKEPKIQSNRKSQPISEYDILQFKYQDEQCYDAETLLLDPCTKDLIIVNKRGRNSKKNADAAFILAYPQKSGKEISKLNAITDIQVPTGLFVGYGITGGDISADGNQLLLKTYTNIYYWQRKKGDSFKDFFKLPYTSLPYTSQEGQGEAVCFTLDGNFYRTIAEESLSEAYISLYQLRKWLKIK